MDNEGTTPPIAPPDTDRQGNVNHDQEHGQVTVSEITNNLMTKRYKNLECINNYKFASMYIVIFVHIL